MSCPICARPTEARYRPFCSRRCADVDLGKWLTGAYAIPVAPEETPEEGLRDNDDGTMGSGQKPH